jgi:diacylglycerol kinase (ATP)
MKNKATGKNPTFFKSTLTAAKGFVTVFRNERKVRLAAVVVLIFSGLAVWLEATTLEILFIFIAWVQVIVGEIFNTSLEKAMDYSSGREFHPLIKLGKDYAAASVFVLSVLASAISLFILGSKFFPH